jgi:hypothetical protein
MSTNKSRPEAAEENSRPEFITVVLSNNAEHLARLANTPLGDEECAAVIGDREWFAAHPERKLRLRFTARDELGHDYPRGVIVVRRLRCSRKRKRPGGRLRTLLYTHWFENQPDPDTAPDDATVRSLLTVQRAEQHGTPLERQTNPAAARVRLWLRPGEGRA